MASPTTTEIWLDQTLTAPGLPLLKQHYQYDELNRLKRALEKEGADPPNGLFCPDPGGQSWCEQ